MYRQGVLLNMIMLTGLAAVLAGAAGRLMPAWSPALPVALVALVALEAGVVHRTYRRDRMWLSELLHYLAPELLVLAMLARVAASLSGGADLAADARRWLGDPLGALDLPFWLVLAAACGAGWLTHITMESLCQLEPKPLELSIPSDEIRRMMQLVLQDKAEALRQVGRRFLFGGAALLVALGVTSVNMEVLGGPSVPMPPASVAGALAYLICGFMLYSRGRLALLRSRWWLDGASIAPDVERRWGVSSWLMVAGAALGLALLPRSYGMGLLETLHASLGLVGYALLMVGYLVVWVFGMLALIPAALMALFGGQSIPPEAAGALPAMPPAPPQAEHQPNLASAMVFWLCMAALVLYALVTVVQRHPLLAERLLGGPLRDLWAWLGRLWRGGRRWAALASSAVRQRLRPAPAPAALRRLRLRLGALAPRDMVRYFYLSTLRRAARGGVARRPAQTPREYAATLSSALPEAEPDIAALTESFVAAQYNPRPVSDADTRRARPPWQRLRDRLRQR
ncbi:DUF4129 domain-containing protein [Chloroflexia bacterium SDU3-3]|nr:DUF4129 domain-containing protein [Chloroflexia bacterium SDU3-3]